MKDACKLPFSGKFTGISSDSKSILLVLGRRERLDLLAEESADFFEFPISSGGRRSLAGEPEPLISYIRNTVQPKLLEIIC